MTFEEEYSLLCSQRLHTDSTCRTGAGQCSMNMQLGCRFCNLARLKALFQYSDYTKDHKKDWVLVSRVL